MAFPNINPNPAKKPNQSSKNKYEIFGYEIKNPEQAFMGLGITGVGLILLIISIIII